MLKLIKVLNNQQLYALYCTIVFLIMLPIVNQISFYQNDDWVYYLNVEYFLKGDFRLHPYLGPTFYTQGLLAAVFAKLFGIAKLPILTLLIAVSNIYIFGVIVLKHLKSNLTLTILLATIVFFNPIYVYLTLGFMTGHYFLLFLLLSIYIFLEFNTSDNKAYLYLLWIIIFAGLNVRQVALAIPLSIGVYYIWGKKYKLGAVNFLIFGLYYYYYSYIFPLTPRIKEVPLQFHHLQEVDYLLAIIWGTLIMLCAFLLPVWWSLVDLKKVSKYKYFILGMLAILIWTLMIYTFKPATVSWGEFPYFENTFERTGYYPRGIAGTKYQFKGIYDLYKYWDLAAKVTLVISVAYIAANKKFKELINFYLIFGCVYIGMLLLTETFYDRYLLPLLPITVLYILELKPKFTKMLFIALTGFAVFLVYYGYTFSMDFVLSNKYIWEKSQKLVKENNANPESIHGTNAWKLTYRNYSRDYEYYFTYDSQHVNTELTTLYNLVEEKNIEFPFNLSVDPKIFLYQLKSD